jgi:hypothetical protein
VVDHQKQGTTFSQKNVTTNIVENVGLLVSK